MSAQLPAPQPEIIAARDLDLIEPRELAAALGMSLRTLQRHHDNRTGPPRITLNKHVFYRVSTVNEWLARCEGYGTAPMRRGRRPVVSAGRDVRRSRRAA